MYKYMYMSISRMTLKSRTSLYISKPNVMHRKRLLTDCPSTVVVPRLFLNTCTCICTLLHVLHGILMDVLSTCIVFPSLCTSHITCTCTHMHTSKGLYNNYCAYSCSQRYSTLYKCAIKLHNITADTCAYIYSTMKLVHVLPIKSHTSTSR